LSYRAQLKNWKFKYLEHIETPAELPAISAARSQQFRWNKAEPKTLVRLLSCFTIGYRVQTKAHGISALIEQFDVPSTFTMAILSIPVLLSDMNTLSLKHF
jgi:hypothetical protein